MLKNLRGFSNTKLAGVLIAIIIVPFVFWGMGSVFSGGNTNNVAKINNKSISTQDFLQYVNQSRINLEYVKENIENNVIEEILTGLVSNKLLEMEIESLNACLLYTSDAADDLLCVDLGGRRIIKIAMHFPVSYKNHINICHTLYFNL